MSRGSAGTGGAGAAGRAPGEPGGQGRARLWRGRQRRLLPSRWPG